ncbi:peptidoglycan recognition protein family protein [Streptomyces carpinensis]|uniref:Peptidoglycan recognition family protein n=1 Tax=Streptomyces carpinensis TaxID=66369 RepID=A0ABV1WBR2_9ACTN|nr:peptidoglycan recognition family protein [Streptomyces carpinensis]
MGTPMTAAQVVAQLKKWNLRYVEIPGWATHNRNSKGAWGPVNGFVWHHTGVDVAGAGAKAYATTTLYNGISGLPGPLCHFSIGADGTVYLVGWGRANHAGGGDPAVLQHVIAEDYTGQLHPTKGNINGMDGNAHFYGVEIQYSGGQQMSDAQYAAARRLSAAILDFHGWTEKSVIAHGEWSSDKWDPGYAPKRIMAMPPVRSDVRATHAAGPHQVDGVPTATEIANAVLRLDGVIAVPGAAAGNPNWTLSSCITEILKRVDQVKATEAGQTAAITKLASLVGSDVDTAAVVSAVQQAIEDAVVKVGVDATGAQN